MKNKRISLSVALIIATVLGISVIGYAADKYTDYKDFLVLTHLVYSPSYSEMFRPADSGKSKLVIDSSSVISTGNLISGVEICNSDGTVFGSRPYEVTKNVPYTYTTVDTSYYFDLSGSATYKAFLEPENGLHLYMNRATIWYN